MLKSMGHSFKQRFIFFGRNSGIHGLNHVFKKNAIFLTRLFWLKIVVLSTGCLYLLLVPVIELDKGISFTPDTRYINWTTTFPAVTVCEHSYSNSKRAMAKLAQLYPDLLKPLSFSHERYLTDLLHNYRVKCSQAQCLPCGTLIPCDVPWRQIVDNVRIKCEELITECCYNGVQFPCCEAFHMVDSEHGPCYSFNTLQNADFVKEPLYTVNRTSGPGVLKFRLSYDTTMSLHSPEELSTNNLERELMFVLRIGTLIEILFSVVEIENDPILNDVSIVERNCRFHYEIPEDMFHTYPVYSYGACKLAQSTTHLYERCECISPARDMKYQKYYCKNYTGLTCLAEYANQITKGLEKEHDYEDCMPSCEESELFIAHHSTTDVGRERGSVVTVRMSSLPPLRYRRSLLRTSLDFVVSVGGIAGVFFSASILSVVEIFYLLLRKPTRT